ncbi:MAG: stage II sporulation protein P [Oscillospiraceae bacterium]|jgi:stage II sporulation protein P|nr:stage II sporulation protein P [Oscillospiraceae bacterium]
MNTNSRRILIKSVAAFTAVSVSPFVAAFTDKHLGSVTIPSVSAAESFEAEGSLLMSKERILAYVPVEEAPVHTETVVVAEQDVETDSHETKLPLTTTNIEQNDETTDDFNRRDGLIAWKTYGAVPGTDFINLEGGGQVRNATNIDREVIAAEVSKLPDFTLYGDGSPEVLIYHNHTSESYQPSGAVYFDGDYTGRSANPDNGVVAVGEAIAREIAAAGYGVIHDGTVHDSPEYKGSYGRGLTTVYKILEQYPSIKVVLDIHRDAIETEDGAPVGAVTEQAGGRAAQVMFIAAADDGTYDVPDFMQNLRFAAMLQSQAEADNPELMRPVLFQYCQYNEQVSHGALLVEVGSHGNTIDEAVYAGELLGKSIARALDKLRT